jgi:hypothetical protein
MAGPLDRELRLVLQAHEKMLTEFAKLHKTRLWELRHQQGDHFDNEIENMRPHSQA